MTEPEIIKLCERRNINLLEVVHNFLENQINTESGQRKQELIKIYNENDWGSAGTNVGQMAGNALNWLKGTSVGRMANNAINAFKSTQPQPPAPPPPAGFNPEDKLGSAKMAMQILQQANLIGPFRDQFNKLIGDLSVKQKGLNFGEWLSYNK
jgi:hypothetical protein